MLINSRPVRATRLTATTSLTAGERKKKEKEVAALRAKAYTEAELEKMGVSAHTSDLKVKVKEAVEDERLHQDVASS